MLEHPVEIDYRSALIAVEEKLRGSRARLLAAAVEDLWQGGYDQILLDLRRCGSLDSLGVAALARALELGQRLFLATGAGFPLEEFLPAPIATHPRVRIFATREEALRAVRSRDGSGVLIA
jgi:hypothetical protein